MFSNLLSGYFFKNLQGKVILVTSIIIFFMIGIFFVFEYNKDKEDLYQRLVYHIKENAFSLRGSIENVAGKSQVQKILSDFAQDIGIGEDSHEHEHDIPPHEVHVVDLSKNIIASTTPELIGHTISNALHHKGTGITRVLNETDSFVIEQMDHLDVKVLAITLPIRKDGVMIGAMHYAEPYSKFEELINESLLRHVVFAIALIVSLSLFINFSLTKLVTRPIHTLSTVMDSIRLGKSTEKVNITSDDEIGVLSRSFNEMSLALQQREEELKKYTSILENMVDERTKKLKESHAQLIQSEKLSSMGKLAGYLAHEINNPIGIIVSRAECIIMDAEEEGYPEHFLKDIEVIRKHSHRIASITNNMLAFTRKSSVHFSTTDVNKIIDDTLLFLEKSFINSNIKVEKSMDHDLPLIDGNANRVQQVLLNILNNARDAMPGGGNIRIESLRDDDRIKIVIADTGTGMTEEQQQEIFEPFFTTKEEGKGTGLGLSVAYGIIEDHKGKINVSSAVGEGTVFEIVLPISKQRVREV